MKYTVEELRDLAKTLYTLSGNPGYPMYWEMGKSISEYLKENPEASKKPTRMDLDLYGSPSFYETLFVLKLEELPLKINANGIDTDGMGPIARWRLKIGK